MIPFWKGTLIAGVAVGALWGWMAMAVNSMTGAFAFEGTLAHNLASFGVGGVVFGVTTAGFLNLLGERIPVKSVLVKAVIVSSAIWLLLRFSGAALSHMDHERFHAVTYESVQGLILAVILGVMTGLVSGRIIRPDAKASSKRDFSGPSI